MDENSKIVFLKAIFERKDKLFGAFSAKLTRNEKQNLWQEILQECTAAGCIGVKGLSIYLDCNTIFIRIRTRTTCVSALPTLLMRNAGFNFENLLHKPRVGRTENPMRVGSKLQSLILIEKFIII